MIPEISCAACREHLLEYLAGSLQPALRASIEAHIEHCSACRRETKLWHLAVGALDDEESRMIPGGRGEETWAQVRARLAASADPGEHTVECPPAMSTIVKEIPMTLNTPDTTRLHGQPEIVASKKRHVRLDWRHTVAAAALVLAIHGGVFYAVQSGFGKPAQPTIEQTQLVYNGDGQLAAPAGFTTTDGLRINLTAIERYDDRWLFAFEAHNQTTHILDILRSGADHRFVLVGAKPAGTPADQGEVYMTSPSAADLADHPALAARVAGGATVSGWLAADVTALHPYPPAQVLYRYATVHTERCDNPMIRSTCQPADLYSALIWDL